MNPRDLCVHCGGEIQFRLWGERSHDWVHVAGRLPRRQCPGQHAAPFTLAEPGGAP